MLKPLVLSLNKINNDIKLILLEFNKVFKFLNKQKNCCIKNEFSRIKIIFQLKIFKIFHENISLTLLINYLNHSNKLTKKPFIKNLICFLICI